MAIEADMTAKQKIERAIVEITSESPFFSFLVMRAKFSPDPSLPALAGVFPSGRGVYNPDQINPPEDSDDEPVPVDEIKGLVCHEALHLALQHPWVKYPDQWDEEIKNMAQEITINAVISTETDYDLPPSDFRPDKDDNFRFPIDEQRTKFVEIKNAVDKDIFTIYNEIKEQMDDLTDGEDDFDIPNQGVKPNESGEQGKSSSQGVGGDGNDEEESDDEEQSTSGGDEGDEKEEQPTSGEDDEQVGEYDINKQTGFDIHSQGDEEDAEDQEDTDKDSWDKALAKAVQKALTAGDAPAGMQEKIEELQGHDFSWREQLDQYVKEELPRGFTYQRPSPTSRVINRQNPSQNTVLPDVRYEESIDVIVGIDSSGSISSELLGHFKGDMISIARSYENVDMRVLCHDTKVHDDWEMRNGQIEQLQDWNPTGRGGTDLRSVFNYVDEHNYRADLIIELTDGRGARPNSVRFPTIWVLAGNHIQPEQVETGRVLVAEEV